MKVFSFSFRPENRPHDQRHELYLAENIEEAKKIFLIGPKNDLVGSEERLRWLGKCTVYDASLKISIRIDTRLLVIVEQEAVPGLIAAITQERLGP